MRILIDMTYAHRAPHSGTAIYLERLIDALGHEQGVEVIAVANERRQAPAGGGLGSVRNLLADQWWTEIELPRKARAAGADAIHHPLPARAIASSVPQVVTVHDLAFERLPQLFDKRFRRYAHKVHRAAARSARAVICVSETTAADARELWGVPAERIVIAHHGPGQELPMLERDPPRHFLYVGDAEPRKDLGTLLEAYRRYRETAGEPLGLVLAGSASTSMDGVLVERDPDRARLAELHAGAAALVHTSLYEGFGLTVLEALAAGTPVIAAAAPGVREICGDAARYTAPGDPGSVAAAMAEIASTAEVRRALSERGQVRAAGFSWATSARLHVEAYSLGVGR
jgi:glycosyltransferase involved in cell wall biosynthesis